MFLLKKAKRQIYPKRNVLNVLIKKRSSTDFHQNMLSFVNFGLSPFSVSSPAYQEAIKVVQPVVLGEVIEYFENYDPNDMAALYRTCGYAAGLSLCTIGLALLHHLYFYHVQRAGMKIRVAMCHMIYNKVSREGTSRGC